MDNQMVRFPGLLPGRWPVVIFGGPFVPIIFLAATRSWWNRAAREKRSGSKGIVQDALFYCRITARLIGAGLLLDRL